MHKFTSVLWLLLPSVRLLINLSVVRRPSAWLSLSLSVCVCLAVDAWINGWMNELGGYCVGSCSAVRYRLNCVCELEVGRVGRGRLQLRIRLGWWLLAAVSRCFV